MPSATSQPSEESEPAKHRQPLPFSAVHEIRNSLDTLANVLQLLEHDTSLSEQALKKVALLQEETTHIAELVRGTLTDYREKPPEAISLRDLLDSVLDLYESRLDSKGIVVSREYKFEGNISVNSRKMREAFANLFLNAIDAMPTGSKMRIRTSTAQEWVGLHRRGVQIVIADTGSGIPAENLRRIFEPFFSTKNRGSGMGLSVVQETVRKHKGTVRVRSATTEGHSGTVFSIFLPTEPTKAA